MLENCKVKLDPKTGGYAISSGKSLELVGVKGSWAEVLEDGDIKYSVSSESGDKNVLRNKFGDILLTVNSENVHPEDISRKICRHDVSDKGSYSFLRSALLPDIDIHDDLSSSEGVALLLCGGKL